MLSNYKDLIYKEIFWLYTIRLTKSAFRIIFASHYFFYIYSFLLITELWDTIRSKWLEFLNFKIYLIRIIQW